MLVFFSRQWPFKVLQLEKTYTTLQKTVVVPYSAIKKETVAKRLTGQVSTLNMVHNNCVYCRLLSLLIFLKNIKDRKYFFFGYLNSF